MTTKTCGTCQRGLFQLTPTGRVKRNEPGHCGKAYALLDKVRAELDKINIPCVILHDRRAFTNCIWANKDASQCPSYEVKK